MTNVRSRALAFAGVLALACGLAPAWGQAPLQVGEYFEIQIDSARASEYEVMTTERGRVYEISHPGATYMAVRFAEFDLAPGDRLIVSDPAGGQSYTMRGRGKMGAGTFWARHVKGDSVVLELVTAGAGRGFVIDRYAAGTLPLGPLPTAICGVDDKQNAVCYQSSHPAEYDRGRAVARLLIQGASLCTGWLASASNHLITNQHCIGSASAALNTDYEFMAEAPNCGDPNCQLCHPGDVYSGASLIQASSNLDYALVQITTGDPAALYGFLSIDNRDAVPGEQIYIPQHPGGRAKELGIESTHSSDTGGVCRVFSITQQACTGFGYSDVGYYCDTEGGSSGSPVLASSSDQVIALHHCANCPNRGVPIDLICAEICGLLGPSCGNGVCDPGESCDGTDGTEACPEDCNVTGSEAECGNGICEAADGEDCQTCAADCNGVQKGKPSGRFCCGQDNSCGQSAECNTGGFQCTEEPAPPVTYCCGNAMCDWPGECDLCALDCDGDPACDVCAPSGAACTDNADCCSGRCKGKKGARTCS